MGRSLDDDSLRPAQGHGEAREPVPQRSDRDSQAEEGRTAYQLRGYSYRLNSKQSAMLHDLGAFRTITAESLRKHVYRGNEEQFRKDFRNLTDQRLVTLQPASKAKGSYVSLTKAGKGLTEANFRTNPDQTIYSGIVKTRELRHDAAIYDVYQKEAKKIAKSGGTPGRVVLDFELKKSVNRQLAKIQNLAPAERERQRQEIADAHGLKIVKGKIQLPDVRVEYESQDQEQCKVDLECVTGHYKARQIAAKTAAGFKLYNQDYRGRSAERGEDLIGEVLSL
jgi:hypothetical protein